MEETVFAVSVFTLVMMIMLTLKGAIYGDDETASSDVLNNTTQTQENDISRKEKIDNAKYDLEPEEVYDEFSDTVYHVHGELYNGDNMIEQQFETHDGKIVTCLYPSNEHSRSRGSGFGMSCNWEGATVKEETNKEDTNKKNTSKEEEEKEQDK